MITSVKTARVLKITIFINDKEDTLSLHNSQAQNNTNEGISDYVAELQLHMTLQARNLVPNLSYSPDSRTSLLQETQANFEKLVSRQVL